MRSRQVIPERRNLESQSVPTAARSCEPREHGTHRECGKHQGSARERGSLSHTVADRQNQQGCSEWWAVYDGANPGIYAT